MLTMSNKPLIYTFDWVDSDLTIEVCFKNADGDLFMDYYGQIKEVLEQVAGECKEKQEEGVKDFKLIFTKPNTLNFDQFITIYTHMSRVLRVFIDKNKHSNTSIRKDFTDTEFIYYVSYQS